MTAPERVFRRGAVALGVVLAALAGQLVPLVEVSPAASVVAAVLTVALVAVAVSWTTFAPVSTVPAIVGHALRRMVPRTAQSDPDGPGHPRPRAPGRLHGAVLLPVA